jgi:hypothetical protein
MVGLVASGVTFVGWTSRTRYRRGSAIRQCPVMGRADPDWVVSLGERTTYETLGTGWRKSPSSANPSKRTRQAYGRLLSKSLSLGTDLRVYRESGLL